MIYLIIGLIALGIITALFTIASKGKDEEDVIVKPAAASCATCSGSDPKCEQECMMEAATKEIEYFDDEELDAFKGKTSGDYSDEEAEQFSEIMYTMRPEEVKDWNRSLILRGINMPDQIKDEAIMLMHNA
jgi:hypothetical protein